MRGVTNVLRLRLEMRAEIDLSFSVELKNTLIVPINETAQNIKLEQWKDDAKLVDHVALEHQAHQRKMRNQLQCANHHQHVIGRLVKRHHKVNYD